MSTVAITAADVNKLRQQTGAGMMDCKKALMEANGDFEAAIDYLRKKGQKVAVNRSDRDAKEGLVLARVSNDGRRGVMLVLNCETDFVAMNQDFIGFASNLLDLCLSKGVKSVDELKEQDLNGVKVADKLFDMIGKIGEKIEISQLEAIEGNKVVIYNHPGNKLSSMVALSSSGAPEEVAKDVAMQVAAMAPVAVDKDDVDTEMLNREIEIGKEQARQEGKPEEMLEKIAMGKLNKFYKENTLLNQSYIKDEKKTISQLLNEAEKGLTVTGFKRIKLGA
jgi:elongation factor Ts